jgi:hypothetical protein
VALLVVVEVVVAADINTTLLLSLPHKPIL